MRAIVAAPTLSGSSSRSPAAAAASRSSRNSGLPPDRSTARSTTCGRYLRRLRRGVRERQDIFGAERSQLDPVVGWSASDSPPAAS